MLRLKASNFVIFVVVCLLDGGSSGPARACYPCATEWSGGQGINLGALPGSPNSYAFAINDAGQVVGQSGRRFGDAFGSQAVEWSGGQLIDLGGLPGSLANSASSINDAGQVVGQSGDQAVEWSGGQLIDLGPGFAFAINNAGQVVGYSGGHAVEWSGGQVIDLGGLPGSTGSVAPSYAAAINDAGQVVGVSEIGTFPYAVEWSGGQVIDLGPGKAIAINNAGQVVGQSGAGHAVEWSGGQVIDLGPGVANAINDAGQVVGWSGGQAVEWSGGQVIDLAAGHATAAAINDAGQVVGDSFVPEVSTWAMMLLGFACLGAAGYRRKVLVAKAMSPDQCREARALGLASWRTSRGKCRPSIVGGSATSVPTPVGGGGTRLRPYAIATWGLLGSSVCTIRSLRGETAYACLKSMPSAAEPNDT